MKKRGEDVVKSFDGVAAYLCRIKKAPESFLQSDQIAEVAKGRRGFLRMRDLDPRSTRRDQIRLGDERRSCEPDDDLITGLSGLPGGWRRETRNSMTSAPSLRAMG